MSSPEYTRAVVNAVAPGRTSKSILFSIHLLTITLPGSDIPVVPASVTNAILIHLLIYLLFVHFSLVHYADGN